MTATQQPESKSTSRRALLAGALGGIGAWAASAIGRRSPVLAEGQTVVVGGEYGDATSTTKISNLTNGSAVLWGESNTGVGVNGSSSNFYGVFGGSSSGIGVGGTSNSNDGVRGDSTSGNAVHGFSSAGRGVYGQSIASTQPGVLGQANGNSTGTMGVSGAALPAAPAKTGVFGYAAQDPGSVGVRGESPAGFGIYGKTTGTGFAGYFNGKVFMSSYVEIAEMTTPFAPGGNRARLFVRDNGLGKTQLCVRFPTGAVKVLATES